MSIEQFLTACTPGELRQVMHEASALLSKDVLINEPPFEELLVVKKAIDEAYVDLRLTGYQAVDIAMKFILNKTLADGLQGIEQGLRDGLQNVDLNFYPEL
jgi:hypothetical protein